MWAYLLSAAALIVAALVRHAFVRQARHDRVDHHYWLQAAAQFSRQRRLPFSMDGRYLLEDRRQSYPPFFAILLSLFPETFLRRKAVLISQVADLLAALLALYAVWRLGSGPLSLASVGIVIGLAPVMVAYNVQVNPRAWGNLFLTLKFLAEAGAVGGGPVWLWMVAVFATALVFLTHKMTTQLMLFLWLPWVLALLSWWSFFAVPLGFALSLVLAGPRFMAFQLRAHLDIVTFWSRHWRFLGAHAMRGSRIYGDPDAITGFHRPGFMGILSHARLLAGYAPALLILPLALPFTPAPPPWVLVWCIGAMAFAGVTLFVPAMKCLGGGHYYVFNAVVPGAIWWSLALQDERLAPILLFFLGLLATFGALALGYRQRSRRNVDRDDGLMPVLTHLRTLPSCRLAVFPVTAAEAVAAETDHSVLWGGHGYGFRRLEPIFPVVTQPLGKSFARHRLDALLLDQRYWPDGATRLRLEGAIGAGVEFGPWLLAPITAPPAPVSVLVVVRSLDVGGAERHLLAVIPALCDLGLRIEIAVLHPGGTLEADFAARGVPLHAIGRRDGIVSSMRRLRRLYAERRPDVIHFFLPEAYLLGGIAALEMDGPALVMSRRSLNRYQTRHRFAALVERFLHKNMDALVGNSRAVLADLRAEGAPQARMHLIPNGVVVAPAKIDRVSARTRLGMKDAPLILVIVANLIPYKGHRDLLAALAEAAGALPNGWRLLCVGRDDGIGADLRAEAERLGIATNTHWLGQRLDVPDLLAAADIAISASHEEGSPNAVIEAMAAGLPVISTAAGGAAELVVPGQTGLLVPPREPAALGAAIIDLAVHPARRVAMGQAGRELVVSRHGLAACVDAYAGLYRRLADQARADP